MKAAAQNDLVEAIEENKTKIIFKDFFLFVFHEKTDKNFLCLCDSDCVARNYKKKLQMTTET